MVSSPPPTSTDSPSSSDAAALEADQLQLVRLGGELGRGPRRRSTTRRENRWPCLTISRIRFSMRLEVLRGERLVDVEVVVEAVLDRRADAELGLGEQLLHGLGHDVRGGVPQDVAAVVAGDVHRLDHVAVAHRRRQVAQLAVDPGGDDAAARRPRAAPAVVPASTTCSLPARVMRSCWLDTAGSFMGMNRTGYPMLSVARRLRVLRRLRYQAGPAQRVGQRAVGWLRVRGLGPAGTARAGTGAGSTARSG